MQGPRPGESRRQGDGVHDHRVSPERQQAASASAGRAAQSRVAEARPLSPAGDVGWVERFLARPNTLERARWVSQARPNLPVPRLQASQAAALPAHCAPIKVGLPAGAVLRKASLSGALGGSAWALASIS